MLYCCCCCCVSLQNTAVCGTRSLRTTATASSGWDCWRFWAISCPTPPPRSQVDGLVQSVWHAQRCRSSRCKAHVAMPMLFCCCFSAVGDIKCKFKNLRTVFNREYKSVQTSRTSGKLYQSKWKHFQQLLFLYESGDQDENLEEDQALRLQDAEDSEPGKIMRNGASSYTRPNRLSGSSTPSDDAAAQQLFCPASSDETKPLLQTPGRLSRPGSGRSYGRASADPRCHWSDAKVQQLISFYSG